MISMWKTEEKGKKSQKKAKIAQNIGFFTP